MADSSRRPKDRNKLQNGGGAHAVLNTDGKYYNTL